MDIPRLSDEALSNLLQLIGEAQWVDDDEGMGSKPYGVRKHPDWKEQADAFEAELRKRKIEFTPVDW